MRPRKSNMGSKPSTFDALNSPGYDPSKLSGSRLEHFQQWAQKAASTFPPAFVNQHQEWSSALETPAGNDALQRGRQVSNALRRSYVNTSKPSIEEINRELGSVDGLFTLFGLHYWGMFANPRMQVLFDTRNPDSAVSALDHGKRVAATLLQRMFGLKYYSSLNRGDNFFANLEQVHQQAKNCPMRPAGHLASRGRAVFTQDQRDTWIGTVMCAAEEIGASKGFEEKLGLWLYPVTQFYGPYLDEASGNLVN